MRYCVSNMVIGTPLAANLPMIGPVEVSFAFSLSGDWKTSHFIVKS